MIAVLVRDLCIHLFLVVLVVADGRGKVSGSLHRHGLDGEEMLKHIQGLERSAGNGDFESHHDRGRRNPVVRQPAVDKEDSRMQDSVISRNTRGFEDLAPHLPLGSLADSSGSGSFLEETAMAVFAADRSATENNQSTELTGLRRELANSTEQSLTELTGHKHEKPTHKKHGVAKPDIATKPDIAMSLATAEGGDPDGGDPKRDARHQKEMVCYNELTVLGDLNEDGRFSPEEWHQMFKALNSKGKETNWRISPEDFRLGLPNCDFLEFAKGDKKDHKEKGKMWNHIDYYEWQGVMENADKDRDFLLNHAEIVEGGFEPHAGAKSETVEDTKETVADTTS